MGTWGAGNYQNDEALDYIHDFRDELIAQIEDTINSKHGMEPDEPESATMLCNIDLICAINELAKIALMKAETVEQWKTAYLLVWDSHIDGMDPKPGFKADRRKVIVETFDRLIEQCRDAYD